MKRVGSEEELCMQLAQYLRLKHPDVIYHFDFGSGLKMTMGQAVRQQRLNNRAYPDLFIAKPVMYAGQVDVYHGLFLELKRDGFKLTKRDGKTWVKEHIAEQAALLQELVSQGYAADFAVGFDQAAQLIEEYLAGGIEHQARVVDTVTPKKRKLDDALPF